MQIIYGNFFCMMITTEAGKIYGIIILTPPFPIKRGGSAGGAPGED
jgi:hypothetical protein